MRFIILLGIILLANVYSAGSAEDKNFAYEFKQTGPLYGTTDLMLDSDGAKVELPNLGVQFIFVEALDKVQIVNLKLHKTATMDLRKWAQNGPPIFTTRGITMISSAVQGKSAFSSGLRSVVYRGGPDKPVPFDTERILSIEGHKDYWLYSEVTFCNEFVLSKKMNEFTVGLFRVGTERCLYPLQCVDFCQSGKRSSFGTLSVKKIDRSHLNISFAKGNSDVKLSDVMSSKSKNEFAAELIKGFSLSSHK
jgi:hypothetical protein